MASMEIECPGSRSGTESEEDESETACRDSARERKRAMDSDPTRKVGASVVKETGGRKLRCCHDECGSFHPFCLCV